MMNNPIKPLSQEKLKIFNTEKSFHKLYSLLIEDKDNFIKFIENTENYQSDVLTEVIASSGLMLMKYVVKASYQGKNSWDDKKIINWMQENSEEISIFADVIKKDYLTYNLSPRVEDKLFELLVQHHLVFKEEFLQEEKLDNPNSFNKFNFVGYMKTFPISYIEKFNSIDKDFLQELFIKPMVSSDLNLIQNVYMHKTQLGKIDESQELFNKFSSFILEPISKDMYGYKFKTDVCEYFLKESNQLESWNFFGPMAQFYDKLNLSQKEVFVVTGISQLFKDPKKPLPSTVYNQDDILQHLIVAPVEVLKKYIQANESDISKIIQEKLSIMWMKNHLDNELGESPKTKSIKI